MKKIFFLILMFISLASFSNSAVKSEITYEKDKKSGQEVYAKQTIESPNPLNLSETESEWTAFWITLAIAAIGVYSIYGFAAGIVAVAITYFVTNGNKKAFKLAILGCIVGMALGALIWIGIH